MQTSKSNTQVKLTSFITFGLIMAFCDHAMALDIDKIRYKNRGAYDAGIAVEYKPAGWTYGTSTHYVRKISGGQTMTFDLTDLENNDHPLAPGTQVWIKIKIKAGETKKCNHDTYIYRASGQVVTFKTAGTTFSNNKCRKQY